MPQPPVLKRTINKSEQSQAKVIFPASN